jgi:hypothetical protein
VSLILIENHYFFLIFVFYFKMRSPVIHKNHQSRLASLATRVAVQVARAQDRLADDLAPGVFKVDEDIPGRGPRPGHSGVLVLMTVLVVALDPGVSTEDAAARTEDEAFSDRNVLAPVEEAEVKLDIGVVTEVLERGHISLVVVVVVHVVLIVVAR